MWEGRADFRSARPLPSVTAAGEADRALPAGQSGDEAESVSDAGQDIDIALGIGRFPGQHLRLRTDLVTGRIVAVNIGERGGEAIIMKLRLTAVDRLELAHQHRI